VTIGHADISAFHRDVAAVRTVADLQEVVGKASDLMEFFRFDSGEVLRKERGGQGPKMLRLLVGNPLIMKEMAKTVPDASLHRWKSSQIRVSHRVPAPAQPDLNSGLVTWGSMVL
jgi:hypothetical protein